MERKKRFIYFLWKTVKKVDKREWAIKKKILA